MRWAVRSLWLMGLLAGNNYGWSQSCPGTLSVNSSSVSVSDASCSSTDGNITGMSVTGGISPLTYSWTDGSGTQVGTSITLTSVGYGVYTFTVTDDNGCSESSGPYVLNAHGGIGLTVNSTDATCNKLPPTRRSQEHAKALLAHSL